MKKLSVKQKKGMRGGYCYQDNLGCKGDLCCVKIVCGKYSSLECEKMSDYFTESIVTNR